jgi:hypothetical protein
LKKTAAFLHQQKQEYRCFFLYHFIFKPTNAALSASLAEDKYIMSSFKTPKRKSSKAVDLVSQFFISSTFVVIALLCNTPCTFFFAIF